MQELLTRVTWGVAMALLANAAAADDTFRCGNRLIEPGMTRSEVLSLCGEPTLKSVETHDVRSGNRVVGKTEVQRWTYESYSTTRVLVFDQDTLKAIE